MRNRRSKQLRPSGSDTASIPPKEPNGASSAIEEVGETSDGEGDYGHDWKALLAESEAERKQRNTKRQNRKPKCERDWQGDKGLGNQARVLGIWTQCEALDME